MDQIPRISEAVYDCMCRKVGTHTTVSIRRDLTDICYILAKPVQERLKLITILSGSSREGFDNLASDKDYMLWRSDQHVIWDLNHAEKYNMERCSLILMECSADRPGYALLQLLNQASSNRLRKSCVKINSGIYISSTKYRENVLHIISKDCFQHGPCVSERNWVNEADYAFCFACNLWPSIANSFILRCQSQGWPPNHSLKDIINSGCHVVPIGFKGSPQEDFEWRISFSLAEQKLVFCMNHTQFMCYGLLKLFLKEVLIVKDTNGQPLLCSYFMKTVLFWVIQKYTVIDWHPSSLLSGFWLCFKFLLSCVYHGILPNFFITENNMFGCKIFGYSQQTLYGLLFDMYRLGIACLLHCQSIRDVLSSVLCNRQCVLNTTESDIRSDCLIDLEFLRNIEYSGFIKTSNTEYSFIALSFAFRCLQAYNISQWQHIALKSFISPFLRCMVFHVYNTSNNLNNKDRLKIMHSCLNMLKVSSEVGCISDNIYLGYFLYSVGKIKAAIANLMMIKSILTQPYMLNFGMVYPQRYCEETRGLEMEEKIRKAFAMDIEVGIIIIKELELEHKVTKKEYLTIPPLVMTLMLLVLCYRDGPAKQQETLYELYITLHHNEERHIPRNLGDISWQILGICQQICGDHQGALLSYFKSLYQAPVHQIQEATKYRIQDVQRRI